MPATLLPNAIAAIRTETTTNSTPMTMQSKPTRAPSMRQGYARFIAQALLIPAAPAAATAATASTAAAAVPTAAAAVPTMAVTAAAATVPVAAVIAAAVISRASGRPDAFAA